MKEKKGSEGPIADRKPGKTIKVEDQKTTKSTQRLSVSPEGDLRAASGNSIQPAKGEELWF